MSKKEVIIVTGGMGFIGSNLTKKLASFEKFQIVILDKLTYASNQKSLQDIKDKFILHKVDICNKSIIKKIIKKYKPLIIFHLAAESHVDRSIENPENFLNTNFYGTYNLLNSSYEIWKNYNLIKKKKFKFIHISTDEVFGDLKNSKSKFSEKSKYKPNSPYSASKAGSDHLVRSWNKTYGLPTIITNCSNNYGPNQFPEKLIPLTIISALKGLPLRVYGQGNQIRDWIHVDDHVDALIKIMKSGKNGENYCIGTGKSISNLNVVKKICSHLDLLIKKKPSNISSFKNLIVFVKDRPGHDMKYNIDNTKLKRELKWKSSILFERGIKSTIEWYMSNSMWIESFEKKSKNLYERIGVI